MDARLYLSLDDAITWRGLRDAGGPEPVALAVLAELAGVDGIVVSLREGPRALRPRDLVLLRQSVTTRLSLDIPPTADIVSAAFDIRPDRVTLVPEHRDGPVGGLDVHVLKDALKKHIGHLHDADVEVGVRIEPALEQVKALHRLDVKAAVLTTGRFAAARGMERRQELARLVDAAALAQRLGLTVALSGGLGLATIETLLGAARFNEVHVGHACLARAMLKGLEGAIADFLAAMDRGQRRLA
ncbi:MAG: pyridoxine 5'-phosphate synthase [Myxococcales bacterium]|nr:pyridoxine 5'-phosphate synthase [Myxococcales bacterium]MCB9545175.1 pyridoxine 5'-phosphate synthase [Myxococcales bacterium]